MHLLIARKGSPEIVEVPDPVPAENEVLIQTTCSAVSPGTELAALVNPSASIGDLFHRGIRSLEKLKRSLAQRGWRDTLAKVEATLQKPTPLGYSLAGCVQRVGSAVDDFHPGDRVVAVGPSANHGSLAAVPRLFCARLPKPEMARDAAVAALACVGIHALHRAELSAGAEVAVLGLGAIGQLTVQALRACGHRVIAFDPVESRRNKAQQCGVTVYDPGQFDFERGCAVASHKQGVDAVFLCLKTEATDALRQAAALCRKRGRLIVVGEFPVTLPRESGYEKEIEIRFSAAYGEGRYDPAYERLDQDYPIAAGRWTVRRNLQLFLEWLDEGRIQPDRLGIDTVDFSDAVSVYSRLRKSPSLLTLFQYSGRPAITLPAEPAPRSVAGDGAIPVAVVGAGRFATEMHLPNLRQASDKFTIHAIVGKTPLRVAAATARFRPSRSTCDFAEILADPGVSAVLLATPHSQHGQQTLAALRAGKHVYVEKPLCVRADELAEIRALRAASDVSQSGKPVLFIGFNRRYAPLSQKLLEIRTQNRQPIEIHYLFRAAPLPAGGWYGDSNQGGRFLGEACHAVDWIVWFAGSPLASRTVLPGLHGDGDIFLKFEDGSRAHLRFQPVFKNEGPKEIVEIRQDSKRWRINDFTHLHSFENDSADANDHWKSKGHREALDAFAAAIAHPRAGEDPHGFLAASDLVLRLAHELQG